MDRLVEWNSKKIVQVLKKILVILQKKTGEKYKLIGIPDTYRNTWGTFLGYWVVSSKKKVFRFNIQLAAADQANFVSVDRFKNGITDEKPLLTLSLEGFGISKIFYSLVDFVKVINVADLLKQEAEDGEDKRIRETKWTPQPEKTDGGKINFISLAANFLGENPTWAASIKSGNFDTGVLAKDLKKYYTAHSAPIAGYGVERLLKPVQKAITLFDDFGGTNAAAKIPIAKTFKGQPEVPIAIAPPIALSKKAQEINDLFSAHKTPEEIYTDFETDVKLMLSTRTPYCGVIAYGPGGTGKTYHAEKVAREEGLSEGVGYHLEGAKIGDADELIRILYENREVPLIIFDDADQVFGGGKNSGKENILKHALDSANPYVQVSARNIKDSTGENIEIGKYSIESKFVICTNLGLEDIGKSDAILTRCKAYNFAFTNEEMKKLLKSRFFVLAQELEADGSENLDMQDCEYILDILQALIDGKKLERFSFRLLKNVLFSYVLAKLQGLDRTKAVVFAVRSSPTK
jgi:hypothetical protein